jgi:hypothetical protein
MIDIIPIIDFSQSVQDATGQLGKRSRRIYENDAKMFALWLQEQGLTIKSLTHSNMIAYCNSAIRYLMASHESILGSFRPGDFKPHQYVNVGNKLLYRFVTAFNPGDITFRVLFVYLLVVVPSVPA